MLRHHLVSKWGVLLLACGLFSAAHVLVGLNVNLFARRRQQMGLLGQVYVLCLCSPLQSIEGILNVNNLFTP